MLAFHGYVAKPEELAVTFPESTPGVYYVLDAKCYVIYTDGTHEPDAASHNADSLLQEPLTWQPQHP